VISFALWLESGLWHFLLFVLVGWLAAVSMGAHAWQGVKRVRRWVRARSRRRRWARSTREPRPCVKPALDAVAEQVAASAPVGGVALLKSGPLPHRAPGAALTPEPAPVEARPSLAADGVDVVTWAIRVAREAAVERSER